jgi:sulfopyruvate decarboxylase alpha subunit
MWTDDVFDVLKSFDVRQVAYVPDAGHVRLIERARLDHAMRTVSLTTEEEGMALLAGAWLGGQRGVLLMQSSGVGNCINMLSLIRTCGFPLLALVTMRGEFGEFNAWQVPMGSASEAAMRLMGVQVLRAEQPDEVGEVVSAAARMAYLGGSAMAVLFGQRLVGAKVFEK